MGKRDKLDPATYDGPATKAELQANHDFPCPICDRPIGLQNVDRHHLVPKSKGGRDQYFVHRICHRKLHATFTGQQLEREFYTWELIKAHALFQTFIAWVAKKDPAYYSGTDEVKGRRR
jgi:hypothetical protein